MMLLIIWFAEGIFPMTIPLHEPSRFCKPLVTVSPAQKLMKLASSLDSQVSEMLFAQLEMCSLT